MGGVTVAPAPLLGARGCSCIVARFPFSLPAALP